MRQSGMVHLVNAIVHDMSSSASGTARTNHDPEPNGLALTLGADVAAKAKTALNCHLHVLERMMKTWSSAEAYHVTLKKLAIEDRVLDIPGLAHVPVDINQFMSRLGLGEFVANGLVGDVGLDMRFFTDNDGSA